MRSYRLMLMLAAVLTACAAPPASPASEIQPTLPPPAAETVAVAATQPATEPAPTLAAPTDPPPATESPIEAMPVAAPSAFVKMEVGVSGALVVESASTIQFTDDFAISPGPDLFVILSGATDLSLDYVAFSQTVTDAPILYLGELASTGGAQTYSLPAGIDLAQYNTVVIWCKQYSVAFAAANLR